jgi:hypothetical protein
MTPAPQAGADRNDGVTAWLAGPLPRSMGQLTELREVYLNSNQIDGRPQSTVISLDKRAALQA